jgi:hypothetical protein
VDQNTGIMFCVPLHYVYSNTVCSTKNKTKQILGLSTMFLGKKKKQKGKIKKDKSVVVAYTIEY